MLKNKKIKSILITLSLFFSLSNSGVLAEEDRTIAILPFTNTNDNPSLDWLKTGIAETLTNKFVNIKSLKIVERLHIEKLLKELAFSQSGFVDNSENLKLGRILSAKYLITGNFQIEKDNVWLQSRLINSETGQIINSAEAQGNKDNIISIEKELAEKLLVKLSTPTEIAVLKTQKDNLDFKSYKYLNQARMIVDELPKFTLDPLRNKNQSKYLQAIDYLENVLEENGNQPEAYTMLGRFYLNMNQDEKAKSYFERAVQISPDYSDAYLYLGIFYRINKDYNNALVYFQKSIEANSENAYAYYGAALANHYNKNKLESLNLIFKALERQPDIEEAQLFLDSIVQDQSYLAFIGNKSDPSVKVLDYLAKNRVYNNDINSISEIINEYPRFYKSYYYLGLYQKAKGNFQEAVNNITKSLNLYPTNPEANYQLGNIYFNNNLCEKALPYYQNYLYFSKNANNYADVKEHIENCKDRK